MSEKEGEIKSAIGRFGRLGFSIFGKATSIGVDVGSRSIKIVELGRKKEALYLKNFVIAKTKEDMIKAGSSGVLSDSAGDAIKKALLGAEIDRGKINVSVPSFSSLITTIEIPKMPSDEIEKVVQSEAPKYIPVQLSDVVYGWQIIEEADEQGGGGGGKDSGTGQSASENKRRANTIKILVVAIMKEISQQYEKVFGSAGLEVDSLEIDSFSLQRSLVRDSSGCYVILDMGNKVSNILVVSNSTILLNRAVDVAGEKITKAIAKSLNVDESRADQFKVENGLGKKGQDGEIISRMAEVVANEVSQTIAIFNESYPNKVPQKVILSGGGAYMSGFSEFISAALGIEVELGDPFSDVELPEGGKEKLREFGPALSVALGLARLGFEEKN